MAEKNKEKEKNESKIVRFPTKCDAIVHILNIIWYHVVAKVLLKANGLKCQTNEFRLHLRRLGSKSQTLTKAEKVTDKWSVPAHGQCQKDNRSW